MVRPSQFFLVSFFVFLVLFPRPPRFVSGNALMLGATVPVPTKSSAPLTVSHTPVSGKLVSTLSLFKGDTLVSSSPSWMPIGNLPPDQLVPLQFNQSGDHSWRLKVSYRVDRPGSEFTLMARISLGNLVKDPIFFISSDDGRAGYRRAYSNWIQPNRMDFATQSSIPVSFSLFSSSSSLPIPRNATNSNSDRNLPHVYIETAELEIWESGSYLDSTQVLNTTTTRIASISKQPGERVTDDENITTTSVSEKKASKTKTPVVVAMETGLSFLRVSSTDGFLAAKEYLSKQIVSLSNLEIITPSSIPVLKIPKGSSFKDYIANYEPQIFSYSQFSGLFDGLESRKIGDWELSSKSYLFIGNNVKPWGRDMFPGQPLVFILEDEGGVMKIKAFP